MKMAYEAILEGLTLIPLKHYGVALLLFWVIFIYKFLEFHFLDTLFRGSPVSLTYNSASEIYHGVASKCRLLHGRYMPTPWLSSPHIQTAFLNFHGRPPLVDYTRKLFHASDGGTFALDWLKSCDVLGGSTYGDDETPIVIVIPGLTSDSSSAYLKHLAFSTAKRGWNVVICNHRGLGGISITSDCFYNAGWTNDLRDVIKQLHQEYPNAPLFAVGTSIGANILVKYLGEDGEDIPIAGAVAICSPWDLLIGSRFICRRTVQKLYDRALTVGLQEYAQLHQTLYSRLGDWDGIVKSRTIRDFDNYATRLVGKFETVDTYYRHCSSAQYVTKVKIPLLCISSLDDPVCTWEAIPWDECRANKNIVLAVARHGGHLAFFEGLTGSSLWWVRAVNEFLGVLHSSPLMHKQKKNPPHSVEEDSSCVDQGPYVNVSNGMVAAISKHGSDDDDDDLSVAREHALAPPNTKALDLLKWLSQVFLQTRRSTWVLSALPLLGVALHFFLIKKFNKFLLPKLLK
ncbi:putative alcohol O-acetyltransferase [Helianthus annuus]|uniref:Alcohol O-acetyltransferase n=1 Tax=Helianthus annuus TaxID=4232 RepID=A0A251VG24_HELAN|nr:embryogenesis-associated protein EMB8 [Helianthus annuus]KAF5818327.1 putative alcohol O-acetyltransferase [Helianthus annuus]KAJ0604625.1 putative alcohol O-acetyltransferase [Helianthus annuus]KAJ0615166.1 putative alcohol O-acetyltransferase [Helianthus annuus]